MTQLNTTAMGCGVDVVELSRFRKAATRGGKRFLARVFTANERRYAMNHHDGIPSLAARFAAKEAVVKAMAQIDPRHPTVLSHVEIRRDRLGRPSAILHGHPTTPRVIQVSLSHSERIAVAFAVVIK